MAWQRQGTVSPDERASPAPSLVLLPGRFCPTRHRLRWPAQRKPTKFAQPYTAGHAKTVPPSPPISMLELLSRLLVTIAGGRSSIVQSLSRTGGSKSQSTRPLSEKNAGLRWCSSCTRRHCSFLDLKVRPSPLTQRSPELTMHLMGRNVVPIVPTGPPLPVAPGENSLFYHAPYVLLHLCMECATGLYASFCNATHHSTGEV